ncbi:MAG TPA: hypothetical protein PKA28_19980 [Methylomusa anaerophila]|uniref:Uncharacterized protein n=1 Tax=Methylomusa anaerophila TaxID=1930071 RepID=A0A348AJQ6_9FIRM|nr:hypothetical protein [Methylomusa anaerophila]BBB91304.1 hypothetical protein MAMMFC1_01976 [Methylomusa anaerophila]HML90713.1 hypothetical protein [Methylomusa anaerophila]
MHMLIMPVANGILPRPQGGKMSGMFILEHGGQLLKDVGVDREILICPWVVNEQELYPVGVIVRIVDIWDQRIVDDSGNEISVLMATLEGRGHARWYTTGMTANYIYSTDVETLNLMKMRKEYPAISGAGWLASGGYTEFRDKTDLPVTIYGQDLETGQEVSITANLGGLVEPEQAHTIEHSIIRALNTCCLCTPRTLIEAMMLETDELKKSVETSIKYTLPEALGVTASGACGNPMTNLAQLYLTQELAGNLEAGRSLYESLDKARRTTMSQLTEDVGLTMHQGLRVLQGLKKGMAHDDTLLKKDIYKKVISRFPFDPWG